MCHGGNVRRVAVCQCGVVETVGDDPVSPHHGLDEVAFVQELGIHDAAGTRQTIADHVAKSLRRRRALILQAITADEIRKRMGHFSEDATHGDEVRVGAM